MLSLSLESRGWVYVLVLYLYCFLLHRFLPPWQSKPGYACDNSSGKPLQYRYNAFYVLFFVTGSLYYLSSSTEYFDITDLMTCYWAMCRAAFTTGLALSLFLFCRGIERQSKGLVDRGTSCLTVNGPRSKASSSNDEFDSRSMIEHFYCGIEWNPTVLGVDVKMFNYLIGAVVLACNVMSALITHLQDSDYVCSNAMYAYVIPMSWFICEYMWFENVHVYTYDIFRERTGFKMSWGSWFFYPFFYCIGIWPIVEHFQQPNSSNRPNGDDITTATAAACVGLFFVGWVLTRGANLQKFSWRHQKQKTFLGIQNETIPHSQLLCSGFWGMARHVNYCGEIIQGLALALPGYLVSGSYVPFLYPLYYILLFVGRDIDDDKACREKYGKIWDHYVSVVPYRIVPGIY